MTASKSMTVTPKVTALPKATANPIAIIVSDRLIINDPKIEPVYNATKGLIADQLTHRPMFTLPGRPQSPYFWYELRFNRYNYHRAYNPQSQSYQKCVSSRSYSMYLHIDINATLAIQSQPRFDQVMWALGSALTKIQVYEIRAPNKYGVTEHDLESYIKGHRDSYIYMLPWYYYGLSSQYAFNLRDRCIVPIDSIPKIPFKHRGCLIETNDAGRIIRDHFGDTDRDDVTLVIVPRPMAHLWAGRCVTIITLAQLTARLRGDSKAWCDSILEGMQQLIIHECHEEFLTEIKRIVSVCTFPTIWVINSLPLHYYFSGASTESHMLNSNSKSNPLKVRTIDLASMLNLWACFTNGQKTEFQTEIYKTIFTQFNKLYVSVTYDTSSINAITPESYILSPFESRIWHGLYGYYNNWLHSLANDPSNRYSMTNTKAAFKLEAQVQQSIHQLLSTIIPQQEIHNHYSPHISFVLTKIQATIDAIRGEIRKYIALDRDTIVKFGDTIIVNPHKHAAQLAALEQSAISINRNYERYRLGSVYKIECATASDQLSTNQLSQSFSATCPICYSESELDTELVWTQFVCGHTLCLDCTLGSIRSSNNCPICKEFINTQRIAVIADTCCVTEQSLAEHISSLGSTSLIITDIDAFSDNNPNSSATTLCVNKPGVSTTLQSLKLGLCDGAGHASLNQVVLLCLPVHLQKKRVTQSINRIIGYLQQMDDSLELRRIELVPQTAV